MTYSAVYCALISKRLQNPITKDDCYCETHHIIPKSEGGLDEKDNLVNLTAREHYIAHLLLAKIYNDHKMWSAVIMMRAKSRFVSGRDFRFNSRVYERMRKKYSDSLKGQGVNKGNPPWNKGKKMSEAYCKTMSLAQIGHTPWNKGKHGVQTPVGRVWTEEEKTRMSAMKKGQKLHWFTDGTTNVLTKECPVGFRIGRVLTESSIIKRCKTAKALNRHWFTDGKTNVLAQECPEGFRRGRVV